MAWFVKEGDAVEEFGRMCEVQSDKATLEITSPYAGAYRRFAVRLHCLGSCKYAGQRRCVQTSPAAAVYARRAAGHVRSLPLTKVHRSPPLQAPSPSCTTSLATWYRWAFAFLEIHKQVAEVAAAQHVLGVWLACTAALLAVLLQLPAVPLPRHRS